MGMTITKRLIFVGLAFSLLAGPPAWAAELPKRVLILDSFGRNVPPFNKVISVFRTELSRRSPAPIDFYEVSLEMARFAQPDQEAPFVNFLKERFAAHPPDLVVSVGGPAVIFFERNGEYLFPGKPHLITAAASRIVEEQNLAPNTAVVALDIDLKAFVANFLQLRPQTDSITVILGSSALEQYWKTQCQLDFASLADRVQFHYVNHLTFDQIESRIGRLPPNAAIFFIIMLVDAAGTSFDPSYAVDQICKAANGPVFAAHESFIGLGTVGGRHIPERGAGSRAAELALSILQGIPPDHLPREVLPLQAPQFDWREVKRWGISESRLPEGSFVRFRQLTLWERYWVVIVAAAGLIALQAFLIAGLLVQKRRRDAAEQERLVSEQRLRTITNALPVAIGYVDADQRYRFNNSVYKEWFGLSPEEATGRTIREVVGESNYLKVVPYIEEALAGRRTTYTQEFKLRDGRMLALEGIYVPDVDAQRSVRGLYILALDVTDRNRALQESRRLQDELLHTSRIATMGELAGTLAHEINQPLSAVMSNAQAALRFLDAPVPDLEEIKEILQDIVSEDARAGQVINRLRGLLKKAGTERNLLDFNTIFKDVVRLLHSDAITRSIIVRLALDPNLPPVQGDRVQLQQVALNLLVNAFEAVDGRPKSERQVRIATCLKDNHVWAYVTDSGSGLPAGDGKTIFDPYYTTKSQGLGLGLSLCRTIIERHQGRIWAANNPNGGATFSISLPLPDETGERRPD